MPHFPGGDAKTIAVLKPKYAPATSKMPDHLSSGPQYLDSLDDILGPAQRDGSVPDNQPLSPERQKNTDGRQVAPGGDKAEPPRSTNLSPPAGQESEVANEAANPKDHLDGNPRRSLTEPTAVPRPANEPCYVAGKPPGQGLGQHFEK